MEQDKLTFFKNFRYTDIEIQSIINTCNDIEHTPTTQMADNCRILVENGYPRTELDFLILTNPRFLTYAPEYLKNILAEHKKAGLSLEELINENPFVL